MLKKISVDSSKKNEIHDEPMRRINCKNVFYCLLHQVLCSHLLSEMLCVKCDFSCSVRLWNLS